ncbi:MAG: hypothetical protein HRT89_12485, partial [Lentisphaeria bacterium]|nr:hypothetical protein [Lentisphaeria bacterium]
MYKYHICLFLAILTCFAADKKTDYKDRALKCPVAIGLKAEKEKEFLKTAIREVGNWKGGKILMDKIVKMKNHPKMGDRENEIAFHYMRGFKQKDRGYLVAVYEKSEKIKFRSMKTFRDVPVSRKDLVNPYDWELYVAAKRQKVNDNDKYALDQIKKFETLLKSSRKKRIEDVVKQKLEQFGFTSDFSDLVTQLDGKYWYKEQLGDERLQLYIYDLLPSVAEIPDKYEFLKEENEVARDKFKKIKLKYKDLPNDCNFSIFVYCDGELVFASVGTND